MRLTLEVWRYMLSHPVTMSAIFTFNISQYSGCLASLHNQYGYISVSLKASHVLLSCSLHLLVVLPKSSRNSGEISTFFITYHDILSELIRFHILKWTKSLFFKPIKFNKTFNWPKISMVLSSKFPGAPLNLLNNIWKAFAQVFKISMASKPKDHRTSI